MNTPDSIQDLIMQELNHHKAMKPPYITTLDMRKGSQEVPQLFKVLDEKQAHNVLKSWYRFHQQFQYPSFPVFYSKTNFCRTVNIQNFKQVRSQKENTEDIEITESEKLFLCLIADRTFLFLEYNEHANNPYYPSLQKIVSEPGYYLNPQTPEEKVCAELVIQQGFVPTDIHSSACQRMKDNYNKLTCALLQRRNQIKSEYFQFPQFSASIRQLSGEPRADELSLGALFHAYLSAAATQAYVYKYKCLLSLPEENWLKAIRCVYRDLELTTPNRQNWALVFYHLFTQKAKELAEGKLKKYTFLPVRLGQTPMKPPEEVQACTSQKIRCNIMLFDNLLVLLPPEDLEYAKFQFYAFTRYDRYLHYDVKAKKDNWTPDFHCPENMEDGVDRFGHMIRRHISYCIPNYVDWLTPGLPNDRTVNSAALATLLLQDASIMPTCKRLTDRVRELINDQEVGPKILAEYEKVYMDQAKTIQRLKSWCQKYNLNFANDDIIHEVGLKPQRINFLCSRFILEHALKEKLILKAQENLSTIASALFPNLCLAEDAFDLYED